MWSDGVEFHGLRRLSRKGSPVPTRARMDAHEYHHLDSQRYRCCCCHVTRGLAVLAVLEMVVAGFLIYHTMAQILSPEFDGAEQAVHKDPLGIGVELGVALATILVAAALLVGLWRGLRWLLMPHLVWSLASVCLSLCYLVLFFLTVFTDDYKFWPQVQLIMDSVESEVGSGEAGTIRWLLAGGLCLLFLLGLGIQGWVAASVVAAVRFLDARRRQQLLGPEALPLKGYAFS